MSAEIKDYLVDLIARTLAQSRRACTALSAFAEPPQRDATALNDSGSEVSTLPLPFLPFSLVSISREYSGAITSTRAASSRGDNALSWFSR